MQDGPELNIALQADRMMWHLQEVSSEVQNVLVETRWYQNPCWCENSGEPVDRESIFTIHMGFIHSRWLHSWIFLHQQYQPESQLLWRQGQRTNIVSLQLSHSLSVYHHKVCFESDIYNFWILIPQIPKKKQTFLWLQESNFEALGLLAECGKAIREFWQNSGMSLQQFRRRTGVGVGWYRMGWG